MEKKLSPILAMKKKNTNENPTPDLINIKDGKNIFEQGDIGCDSYEIIKGDVRVLVGLGGIQKEVCILSPGQTFGQIAQLSPTSKRTASCIAKGDVSLKIIDTKQPTINLIPKLNRITSETDDAEELEFKTGECIIKQGTTSNNNSYYVILEGIVDVKINNLQINTMVEGEIFGECALLSSNKLHTAHCIARGPVKILRIGIDSGDNDILDLLKRRRNQSFSSNWLSPSSPTNGTSLDNNTPLPKLDLSVRRNSTQALIALEELASNWSFNGTSKSDITKSTKKRVSLM